MESALSSLIIFTVGLFAAVTLSFTYLETQHALWSAEQAREEETIERARTDLSVLAVDTQSSGSIIRVKLRNSGQTKLADFEKWDVVVEHTIELEDDEYTYAVHWLPYTATTLQAMQWTVDGIYMNADTLTAEAFEPAILNPGEEMIVHIRVSPPVPVDSANRVTISTDNGISVVSGFSR